MSLNVRQFPRGLLLLSAVAALVIGVSAGLARNGWPLGSAFLFTPAALAAYHGPLMMSAFFGTVISLERAVALNTRTAWSAPVLSALSGLALLATPSTMIAPLLATLASVALVMASLQVVRKMNAAFTMTLLLAAGCWLMASLIWLTTQNPSAPTTWWLLFLVITIAGERLELTRFLPTPRIGKTIFSALMTLLLVGGGAAMADSAIGFRLVSLGLAGLALWLVRFDIARHNLTQTGATRYIAICLFSGYLWLMLAGILGLASGFETGHFLRDATLHAVTLGFVLSMVFGHALIIFPAIAKIKVPFHWIFYLPLGLLWVSLSVRILGGLLENFHLNQYGALLNAATLTIFFAILISRALVSPSQAAARSLPPAP